MIRLEENVEDIDPEEERLRALKLLEHLQAQRAAARAEAQVQADTQVSRAADTHEPTHDEVTTRQQLAAVVRQEEEAQVQYRVDGGEGSQPSRAHSVAHSAKDTSSGVRRQRKTTSGPNSSVPRSAFGRSRQTPTPTQVKDASSANPWFEPLTTMQPSPLQTMELSPGVSMVDVATGRGKSVAMKPIPRQMSRQEYIASISQPGEPVVEDFSQGQSAGNVGSPSLVLAGLTAGGSVGSLGAFPSAPSSPASKIQEQFQALAAPGNRHAGNRNRAGATWSSNLEPATGKLQGSAYSGGPVRLAPRPAAVRSLQERKMGGTIVATNKELLQSLFSDH